MACWIAHEFVLTVEKSSSLSQAIYCKESVGTKNEICETKDR